MAERKVKAWITLKGGRHIPIFEGESKADVRERIKENRPATKESLQKKKNDVVNSTKEVNKAHRAYKEKKSALNAENYVKAQDKQYEASQAYQKEKSKPGLDIGKAKFKGFGDTGIKGQANNKEHGEGKYDTKNMTIMGKEYNDKIESYRNKFLTKRSTEEIDEIYKNTMNSKMHSPYDDVIIAAIRREKEIRADVKKKQAKESKSNNEVTREQKEKYLKEHNLDKYVRELNSNSTERGAKAAIDYVYDQHTLTPEQFKAKYFGDEARRDVQIANSRKQADERTRKYKTTDGSDNKKQKNENLSDALEAAEEKVKHFGDIYNDKVANSGKDFHDPEVFDAWSNYDDALKERKVINRKLGTEYGSPISSYKEHLDYYNNHGYRKGDAITLVDAQGNATTWTYNESSHHMMEGRDIIGQRKVSVSNNPMWESPGKQSSNIVGDKVDRTLKQGGHVYFKSADVAQKLKALEAKSDAIMDYAQDIGTDLSETPKSIMKKIKTKFNLDSEEAEYVMTNYLGWRKGDLL